MPTILPPAKTTFLGPNGEVLSGGSVAFSIPGTTTPKNTYQDSDQTILNQNPVPLDANGQALIWGTGSYRQRVYDANENLIWDQITEDTTAGLLGNMTDEMGSGGTPGFAANVDFTPGTTTSLTLSTNYGSTSNLWVAFDAAEQGADSYSLSGTELTFVSPIPVGVNKVYVKGGSTIAIGTPGNGTITDASVAPGAAIQSSKLSYLQGGSGSVVRTILSRLQDYVSVKDFGATGNGTTDDTEAIQAALSWASAAGGSVYMPPGKYVVSSTLTITGSFVRLFGAGKSIATIAFSPSSGDTLLIGSATSALESVYVDGIGFAPSVTKTSAARFTSTATTSTSIWLTCSSTKVSRGSTSTARRLDRRVVGSSYHITNCYIESCTYAGVEIGSSNGWVQGVWMDECTIAANAHGLLIQNCSALYASRLDIIEQTVDGISVNPYNAGMYAIDLFFNNVQCDSTNGIGWSFNQTNGIVGNVVMRELLGKRQS